MVPVKVIKKGERGVIEYSKTQRPGLYKVQLTGGSAVDYVVNADRAESNLAKLTPEEIKALAKANGLQVVKSAEEFKARDKAQRVGLEIWKWALLILLGLLFAELILQQKFARGKGKV